MERKLHIGVAGAADCDSQEYMIAQSLGAEIAKAEATLICGGRLGVMEAAAKGARLAGGTTIGILPGVDRSDANEYIEYAICTGMGQARNIIFVLSCDVLIAVGGEWGTLSEIASALKHQIPVVSINSWEKASLDRLKQDGIEYHTAKDPKEAVDLAVRLALQVQSHERKISRSDS